MDAAEAAAVEAIGLSKRFGGREPGALVPVPWFSRRRRGLDPSELPLGDVDDDLDDEDDEDEDDEPVTHPARDVWALRDIDFSLAPGSVLGVIGENGAGKSTLIRVLGRVTTPTAGMAITRGRIAPDFRVVTAFLDQTKGGVECIHQVARFCRVPRSVATAAIEPIREFTQLGDALELPLRTYSTGQRHRLAYALTLCLEPEVLLTDGVLAVGDRPFRLRCMDELTRRVAHGLTVVVATHDTALVHELCTHALLLREGRVDVFGSPAEVVARYEAPPAFALPMPVATRRDDVPLTPLLDPADDAQVTIQSAGVYDVDGVPLASMRSAVEAHVEVAFEVFEAADALTCIVDLYGADGTRVRLAQPEPYRAETAGVFAAGVRLAPGTLAASRYRGKARLVTYDDDGGRVLAESSFALEVGGDRGDVPPPTAPRWSVARIES